MGKNNKKLKLYFVTLVMPPDGDNPEREHQGFFVANKRSEAENMSKGEFLVGTDQEDTAKIAATRVRLKHPGFLDEIAAKAMDKKLRVA